MTSLRHDDVTSLCVVLPPDATTNGVSYDVIAPLAVNATEGGKEQAMAVAYNVVDEENYDVVILRYCSRKIAMADKILAVQGAK